MQAFIDEYIEIEHNPRNHRKRGCLLKQLLARYPQSEVISIGDLLLLLDHLKLGQTTIRMPLFAQIIYPVLKREIEDGNLSALKVLLQYTQLLNQYYAMLKIFNGDSEGILIERYLQHIPDDREILLRKEALLRNSLSFAVHELPRGVLYGMNGASVDECLELLRMLEDYTNICNKLQIDCSADLHYYAIHFQGYQDYLLHRPPYTNYLDYIHQHHLELRET